FHVTGVQTCALPISDTDDEAWDTAYPGFEEMRNTIGAERGWGPYSRAQFQQEVGPAGAVYSGSPDRVARKIADTITTLGIGRFRTEERRVGERQRSR